MKNWIVPVGLIALSTVPLIGGAVRLNDLNTGSITPENARFFLAKWPVVIHIFSVTFYSVLGAFQFAPNFRKSNPNWHRRFGKILVLSGFLIALTGLWMTQFFSAPIHQTGPFLPAHYDGAILYYIRWLVGTAMTLFLILGVVAILKRNFRDHGSWMIRAYALALGAGTQVITHIPWFLFPSLQSELTRAMFMALGWVINITVAELIIRKKFILKKYFNNTTGEKMKTQILNLLIECNQTKENI